MALRAKYGRFFFKLAFPKYICHLCEYKSTKQSKLTFHIKSIHEEVKYFCPECQFKAINQIGLNFHINTNQHRLNRLKYSCDKCEYTATWVNNLTMHIKSIYEGMKYSCDQCNFEAIRKNNLTLHIESIHKGGGVWEIMTMYDIGGRGGQPNYDYV